jgi:3-oxoacyl-[acyl-carrier protein] reductase
MTTETAPAVSNNHRLSGRVALVTGAAGADIGQAIARRLASEGAIVIVTDKHERRLAEVTSSMQDEFGGDHVVGIHLDLQYDDSMTAAIESVSREFDHVDILVNNAAVAPFSALDATSVEEWDRIMRINLKAPWMLTSMVLPAMKANGYGQIVNVSSIGAWDPLNTQEGVYCATKAALHSITRTFAKEVGPFGVRCNVVAPGICESAFIAKNSSLYESYRSPLGSFPSPSDVAACVAFLVSEDARFITGEAITVSAGFYMHA